MVFSNNFERRFGWLAFPGFLRYYAMLQVLSSVVMLLRPELADRLWFSWSAILNHGEWWRVVTCLFSTPQLSLQQPLSLIFLVFMVLIAFMISDALEAAWGEFKTSLFFYSGVIGLVLANAVMPMGGRLLLDSAFLAFATLFPTVELRFNFIIPVQVRFLAILDALFLLWPLFKGPPVFSAFYFLVLVLALHHYVLWAGIPALRRTIRSSVHTRKLASAKTTAAQQGFYRCAICERTDVSNPELEFRVGTDGRDYCEDHLQP